MAILRLAVCVGGVYSMFLLWAIAQERLSVPFKSLDGSSSDKFRSSLIIGDLQSAFSCISALLYLLLRKNPSHTFAQTIGLRPVTNSSPKSSNGLANHTNGSAHTSSKSPSPAPPPVSTHTKSLMLKYLQCSLFITTAAPFGFAALSYITYPAMVLAKSCKLVPVMLMNVLLYRRKFAFHKYIVVVLVTIGITAFMFFGNEKPSKATKTNSTPVSGYGQAIGLTYLLLNLILDGLVNSTQDQIFSIYKPTGQQMMLFINVFSTLISTTLSILPLPYIPVIHPTSSGQTELGYAIEFIRTHPGVLIPLFQFALTGALGQLFIFETLQHFGSLTLVTITLTRKLFTMLLSVVLYNHSLTPGQWLGAFIVFVGISVEAWVKRRDVHAKRVIQEKEKAKIKEL